MKLPSKPSIVAGAVLVLSSLSMVSAASAGGTAADRIPVLRTRTLVLTADGPGYVDVRIPRRTVVDTSLARRRAPSGPNRHVRISGGGPFTGVLMAPVSDQLGVGRDRIALVGQFEGCSYGCTDPRTVNFVFPLNSGAGEVVLPANVYRIYFIAGDGPSRVAVTFGSGRKGKTFVTPTGSITFSAAVPAAAAGSSPSAFSAGADYEQAEKSFRFSVMDLIFADRGSSGAFGSCLYQSHAAAPAEPRFLPGCPEGPPTGKVTSQAESLTKKFYVAQSEYVSGAGPWAFGMWDQSSVDIVSVLHGSVFLSI
jgi:hypothetical protein